LIYIKFFFQNIVNYSSLKMFIPISEECSFQNLELRYEQFLFQFFEIYFSIISTQAITIADDMNRTRIEWGRVFL